MENHLKDMRKIADRVLFHDHSHEKEIINQINQQVRVTAIKRKRKWPELVRYLVHGSILALFVFTFAFIIMNNLDSFSSVKKDTASIDDAIFYDPATFKGLTYTGSSLDYGLERARKLGVTQNFQKTVTSNHIQFKIEDVYYDGASLTVAYRVKNQGSEKLRESTHDEKTQRTEISMKINNTKPNGTHGISSYNNEKKLSPKEYEGIFHISLTDPDEKFTLNLSVTKLMGINGKWNINIPISKEKSKNSIATFYPNYKTTWEDGEITVNRVMFTPSAMVFDIKLFEKSTLEYFMGSNSIQFSLLNPNPEADGGFSSQGVQLNNGKWMVENIVYFSPKSSIPNEITLRAYNSKDGSEVHRFTFPLSTKELAVESNNALAVGMDGRTNLVPAEILKNVGIVKKIKIPVGGIVRNIDEKTVYKTPSSLRDREVQPFIYETASNRMIIEQSQMDGTIQHYLDHYKPLEQNKKAQVVKVDMEKYPQLKSYDGMLKVKGDHLTEYYLIKSYVKGGEKKVREIKIQSPTNYGDSFLLKMISSVATAEFK